MLDALRLLLYPDLRRISESSRCFNLRGPRLNELVDRLINYLENERVLQRVTAEGVPVGENPEEQIESIFVGGLFFLEKFSRIIEKTVLDRKLEGGNLFVNFQTFENFAGRRETYDRIDELDNHVYVYGTDAAPSWPYRRIRAVQVDPRDSLAHMWFVVYDNPSVSYALVASGKRVSDGPRRHIEFRGLWTARTSVTHSVRDYLLRVVNAQYGVTQA